MLKLLPSPDPEELDEDCDSDPAATAATDVLVDAFVAASFSACSLAACSSARR